MHESEKASIISKIDSNKYIRRTAGWNFRTNMGPKDYLARCLMLVCIFGLAFVSKVTTPKGREDRDWLIEFSMVMFIWYTAIHSLAYIPAMIFNGFGELTASFTGNVAYAYNNWRDYQYAAFIIVFIVVMYPFGLFGYLIYDGFDPYRDLTSHEMKP